MSVKQIIGSICVVAYLSMSSYSVLAQNESAKAESNPATLLTENTPNPGAALDLFEKKVEVYARIVQTYGLAVFLVLFYVLVVWKKQNQDREKDQEERTSWIEQVTSLRVMIDPIAKKLTEDQARTILQMTIAGRIDLIKFGFNFSTYPSPSPSYSSYGATTTSSGFGSQDSGGPDQKSIYLFGEIIYLPANLADEGLAPIVKNIQDLITARAGNTKDQLRDMRRWLDPIHQRVGLRLNLLQFDDTTLGDIYRQAYATASEQWKKSWNGLPEHFRWELETVKRDLLTEISNQPPPVENELRKAIDGLFRDINYMSQDESLFILQNTFESAVDKELSNRAKSPILQNSTG